MNVEDLFKKDTNEIPGDYIKALVTTSISMLIGQIVFAVSALIVMYWDPQPWAPQLNPVFMYLVPILILTLTPLGIFLSKKKIESLNDENILEKKLQPYRSAILLRCTMLQIPAFVACIAIIETYQLFYFVPVLMMLIFSAAFLTSKNKIIRDLQL